MAPITTWMHQKQCQDKFKNFSYIPDLKYCEAYFDSVICWKPTPAGNTTFENCPDVRLSDPTKLAFRTCGQSGLWLNRRQIESSVAGWTNYTPCFPANVKHLFDQVTDDDNAQIKSKALIQIARNTRILDIIGFSVSLIALVLSLFIFTRFRSLKNHRNRIHKSLFTAMILQYLLQQLLYIDQEFARSRPGDHFISTNSSIHVIENTPYVCEIFYVLLEYFISAMFIWMLIEGIYLNSLVSIAAFKYRVSYVIYYSVGWGVPFIITAVWAVITALHYQKEDVKKCWYGYNFERIYWIVQGPRLGIVVVNFIFQLNILRVLVMKLRTIETTEIARARKALRATLVLLPLLGITNALDIIGPPLDGSVLRFAIWSYVTHFLRSFQGFFVALIYCFLNAEVRFVIRKYLENRQTIRDARRQQRSLFRNNGFGDSDYEGRPSTSTSRSRSEATRSRLPLRTVCWPRGNVQQRHSETRSSIPDMEMHRISTGTDMSSIAPRRYSTCGMITKTVAFVEPPRPSTNHNLRNTHCKELAPDEDETEM